MKVLKSGEGVGLVIGCSRAKIDFEAFLACMRPSLLVQHPPASSHRHHVLSTAFTSLLCHDCSAPGDEAQRYHVCASASGHLFGLVCSIFVNVDEGRITMA